MPRRNPPFCSSYLWYQRNDLPYKPILVCLTCDPWLFLVPRNCDDQARDYGHRGHHAPLQVQVPHGNRNPTFFSKFRFRGGDIFSSFLAVRSRWPCERPLVRELGLLYLGKASFSWPFHSFGGGSEWGLGAPMISSELTQTVSERVEGRSEKWSEINFRCFRCASSSYCEITIALFVTQIVQT